ncbi:MAG: AAA domain-containing protein [Gammaproteobacteria bacterium]
MPESNDKLVDLIDYVRQLAELGQKPVFSVKEYKQLLYHESALKNRIGIHHNLNDDDGPIWLKIERLKRLDPPEPPEIIRDWITVGRDPFQSPAVADTRTDTLDKKEAARLVEEGVLDAADVQSALKPQPGRERVDVIYRRENLPEIEHTIEQYLGQTWTPWSETEKPRRESIAIYDKFFSTYQAIASEDGDEPLELVWGVGIARWKIQSREIDHPLIEQLVDLQVNTDSGAITLRPRSTEPQLALKPYFALEISGADTVFNFARDFLGRRPEDEEFSPFLAGSFEPILRQAVAHLDNQGQYHPDERGDITDRGVPNAKQTLAVTDTWAIYARRRSDSFFVADLDRLKKAVANADQLPGPAERLVTEPPDEGGYHSPVINLGAGFNGYHEGTGGSVGGGRLISPDAPIDDDLPQDFFFPKAFNDEQISIVQRLSTADGVVVQGPPGTGKTHTIANIICHYLATGKRVLVTSQKEGALSVLRQQVPEGIRDLVISLLTNEREGLKQLETAVRLLANTATRRDPRQLERDIIAGQQRIVALQNEIAGIETELEEWANKHLRRVDGWGGTSLLPEELARQLVDEREQHVWFPDNLSADATPQFTDAEIARLRESRKTVGNDLAYLNEDLPALADLPDSAVLAAIHQDLVNAQKLDRQARAGGVPMLSLSATNAIDRAQSLLACVQRITEFYERIENSPWLRKIFAVWQQDGFDSQRVQLFAELVDAMRPIHVRRNDMLRAAITVSDEACSDPQIATAVARAAEGSSPFGWLAVGKSQARQRFGEMRLQGRRPDERDEWQLVADYLAWRREISSLCTRWNRLGAEFDLPDLADQGEATARWISATIEIIDAGAVVLITHRSKIESELPVLFPAGLNAAEIVSTPAAARQAAEVIRLNLAKHRLAASRSRITNLRDRLAQSGTPLGNRLHAFLTSQVGHAALSASALADEWEALCRELAHIHELRPAFATIERVAAAIESSGAPKWADALRTQPVAKPGNDAWTPSSWRSSWEWARLNNYLRDIDGRDRIRQLSANLLRADKDLKKTFQKVVELRTYLGLKQTLTQRVQSALNQFVTFIEQIAGGTGIRAPRFRRNARDAMERCYSAVSCWIMPIWRVSESLPAALASFDLVIVDEASQSEVSALPALLRGKKLLIVGDDKQVSPTAGFIEELKIRHLQRLYLRDQPYAALVLPGGSLYSLAQAMFPGTHIMLREHFRCVEPIIRFSFQFYDDDLIPLRVPAASERLDPPLIDVYVTNGHKDRRKINVPEARAIVDEIERLVNDPANANRSMGVVSRIGAQQAHYIAGLLLDRIGEEAFLRHRIACGDAATFQGKERDIMFISMVASPHSRSSQTALHFQQRFNVALSRARDRQYLFRSVTEEMLNPNDLKAKVIRHFRSPMPAARQITEDLFEICDSDFEREVLRRLLDLEYQVTPQVNVGGYSIDLVVEGAEGRRLAIELDGDQYHPPEQWIEDFTRQRVLERVGWTFWRCWGSSFALDPDACMEDLVGHLTEMGIEPLGGAPARNIYTEHRVVGPSERSEEQSAIELEKAASEPVEGIDVGTAPEAAESAAGERPQAAFQLALDELESRPSDEMAHGVVSDDESDGELTIQPGDQVLISYNDEPSRQYTLILSTTRHDPDHHVINHEMPLAKALMGWSEEDEVEIPAGDGTRTVTILRIERGEIADEPVAQTGAADTSNMGRRRKA